MKNRSHHLPAAESSDDWGDGSWTVDCSCGVTFDDGEEMVSCDDCGVWVHTRCARYVRGEDPFTCHKCKPASSRRHQHDSTEETEVAQLLVELPIKAASPCPLPQPASHPLLCRRRPHVPMEERVHVHGIPGGDPSLFEGVSSIFTRQLWKATGCVPKKFDFRYRELPYWCYQEEEDAVGKGDDEDGGENPASKGADVLFSLSKESVPRFTASPVPHERLLLDSSLRKSDDDKPGWGSHSKSVRRKERTKSRTPGAHSSRRRKEVLGEGKKGAHGESDRAVDDTGNGACSTPQSSENKARFCSDSATHVAECGGLHLNSECRKEDTPYGPKFNENHGADSGSKPKHILVIKAPRGGANEELPRQKLSLEMTAKINNVHHLEPVIPPCEGSFTAEECGTKEEISSAIHGLKQSKDGNNFEGILNGSSCCVMKSEKTKLDGDTLWTSFRGMEKPVVPSLHGTGPHIAELDGLKVQLEEADDQDLKLHSTDRQVPHQLQRSIDHPSEDLHNNQSTTILAFQGQQSRTTEKESETSNHTSEKIAESNVSRLGGTELHVQVVKTVVVQKDSLEPMHDSKFVDGATEVGHTNSSTAMPNARKLVRGFPKASSVSSAQSLSRSSFPGSCKSSGTFTLSSSGKDMTKQPCTKTACTGVKAGDATSVEFAEESKLEVSRLVKDHPKDSEYFGPKPLHVISNYIQSDLKELLLPPSSESHTTEKTAISSSPGEATGLSQVHKDSVQTNLISSGACQKNVKINQPSSQSSSRVLTHQASMHPPPSVNASTTLSDEELALLLHQELNSSPRVPRVPRVRQAASMQSSVPTPASNLKRSSSSGVKDQVSVFRRRNKEDAARDGCRSARDFIDETQKMATLTSPDRKHQESASMSDGSSKKDSRNKSPDTVTSMRKNNHANYNEGGKYSAGSLDTNEKRGLSIRSSHGDHLDDVGLLVRRTLPGLVDEILSTGKRMTYEELCEAVRPHWHNLRKPNGERYAYPTHSHAVLDCLRNRSEWARLVDRGPKTNSNKRKRKPDSDTATIIMENEETRNKTLRDVDDISVESHREDFPKGKRKARQRRRLELGGRGVKEARKSESQGAVSDYDRTALSHSSNDGTEGNISDDEIQRVSQHAVEDEVSSSGSDGVD